MTREEAENKIANHLREIVQVLKTYNPDADYLSLTVYIKENWLSVNNKYWLGGSDENNPINFYGHIFEEDKQMTMTKQEATEFKELQKENEPAPSEAVTSSEKKLDERTKYKEEFERKTLAFYAAIKHCVETHEELKEETDENLNAMLYAMLCNYIAQTGDEDMDVLFFAHLLERAAVINMMKCQKLGLTSAAFKFGDDENGEKEN